MYFLTVPEAQVPDKVLLGLVSGGASSSIIITCHLTFPVHMRRSLLSSSSKNDSRSIVLGLVWMILFHFNYLFKGTGFRPTMGFQILEGHHSVNSQRLVRTPCNKVHLHTLFMILIIVFCLTAMLPLPLQRSGWCGEWCLHVLTAGRMRAFCDVSRGGNHFLWVVTVLSSGQFAGPWHTFMRQGSRWSRI